VSAESTDETSRVARQAFLNWDIMNNVKITFAKTGISPFKIVTFSIHTLDQALLPLLEACLECSFLDVQQHPPAIQLEYPPYPQITFPLTACLSLGTGRNYKEVAVLLV